MEKKDKFLILLYARDFNRGRGINYGEFFELRPKSMEDVTIHEMSEIFDKELRTKEGLLIPGNRGRYLLTKKGEKELKKYLKGTSIIEMNYLSKNFRQFGTDYRLKLIETLIGSTFMLGLIILLAETFIEKINSSTFLQTIFIIFFFLFLILGIIAGTTITFNFFISWFSQLSKQFSKKIKTYPGTFLGISIALILIIAIWLFLKFTEFDLKDIILELIISIIILAMISFKKILIWFKNILNLKTYI